LRSLTVAFIGECDGVVAPYQTSSFVAELAANELQLVGDQSEVELPGVLSLLPVVKALPSLLLPHVTSSSFAPLLSSTVCPTVRRSLSAFNSATVSYRWRQSHAMPFSSWW
jgi:hypothetical protein